jgi:hypothetical protein
VFFKKLINWIKAAYLKRAAKKLLAKYREAETDPLVYLKMAKELKGFFGHEPFKDIWANALGLQVVFCYNTNLDLMLEQIELIRKAVLVGNVPNGIRMRNLQINSAQMPLVDLFPTEEPISSTVDRIVDSYLSLVELWGQMPEVEKLATTSRIILVSELFSGIFKALAVEYINLN